MWSAPRAALAQAVVMDESKLRPGFPGDRSQAAAEKLRALRERANQTLDDHRRRLGEIETQLSDRVRRLAEEFDGSPSEGPSPPVQLGTLSFPNASLSGGVSSCDSSSCTGPGVSAVIGKGNALEFWGTRGDPTGFTSPLLLGSVTIAPGEVCQTP